MTSRPRRSSRPTTSHSSERARATTTTTPCACGRTARKLTGWKGRADDTAKVKGQFIYPAEVGEVGAGEGEGYSVNVPLARGSGDRDFGQILHRLAAPLAQAYQPEMILVSCGFDLYRHDPDIHWTDCAAKEKSLSAWDFFTVHLHTATMTGIHYEVLAESALGACLREFWPALGGGNNLA